MANFAQGAKLLISDGELDPVFFEIANLININNSNITADEIDTSSHSKGVWRTFKQGLKDRGNIDIEGFYVVDESLLDEGEAQEIIDELFNSGEIRVIKLAWPLGGCEYFVQEVMGYIAQRRQPEAPVDDLLDFSATIKVASPRFENEYNKDDEEIKITEFDKQLEYEKGSSAELILNGLFSTQPLTKIVKEGYITKEFDLYN